MAAYNHVGEVDGEEGEHYHAHYREEHGQDFAYDSDGVYVATECGDLHA